MSHAKTLKTNTAALRKALSYLWLIALGFVMIYPLLWMAGASFKTNQEIFGSVKFFPTKPVFDAFKEGWKGSGQYTFGVFLMNTFLLVVPAVLFTAVSSVLVGYGFARFNFPFKKILFSIMLATLMLPATVIVIPRYIFFKNLGWLDSYMPFIIPAMLATNSFFNYQMVQFFRGVPASLDESAKLDGCGSFRTLVQILLPLCGPAVLSVVVFQFVWTWNDFFNVLIYISSVKKYPIALGLRMAIDIGGEVAWNQVLAMSTLAVIPPMLLFFLSQKYFVQGISTSGMKD